jgi:probable HAF family extracellular repeat protein
MSKKFSCLGTPEQHSKSGIGQASIFAVALIMASAAHLASAQDKSRDDDANPNQFAYVANFGSQNTITGLAINESTGALTPVHGSPFNNVDAPISVTVDPTGRFVYATQGAAISGYTINAETGALTRVRRSPFSSPDPRGIVVDPTGRFVYVANFSSGNVTAYTINTDNGRLADIPGSPFAADSGTYSVAVDPKGHFLYASNPVAGDITEYAIDANTGVLTQIPGSPVTSGQSGYSIAIEPLGEFLFQTSQQGTVLAFNIDPTTGALSPAAGSPFAAGIGPFSVAADPTGRFVYVVSAGTADPGTATVSAYTISRVPSQFGVLTPVSGSPFTVGFQADFVTVDPTGRFVYVANWADSNIGVYSIATNGSLTPIAGSPFPAGSGPNWIAISPGRRRTHPIYSGTQIPPPNFLPVQTLTPTAIDKEGEVAGSVVFVPEGFEAFASGFLYSGGTSITVGMTRSSQAFGINDKTQVVGQTSLTPPVQGEPPQHAFVYSSGTTTILDSVVGRQSAAYGINNAGTITGSLSTGTCGGPFTPCPAGLGDTHAFEYKGTTLTDLGTLGGDYSVGRGINNRGEIVGGSNRVAGGPLHLFLFDHGKMGDLGTLKGNSTGGLAINDQGQIIGAATGIGFLYSNGNFHRLPAFNGGTYSLPAGINNGGAVVGTSDVYGGGPTRAFLYTDGDLIDLNNIVDPSLPLLTTAAGINDKGQIVATGLNGKSYVLTPKRHGDD